MQTYNLTFVLCQSNDTKGLYLVKTGVYKIHIDRTYPYSSQFPADRSNDSVLD